MLLVSIGRLLDHDRLIKPLPLVKDGDLIALARYMIRTRGRETVRVTKVKGHANETDVEQGRVRLEDQLGNVEADAAADLGRRHQSELLIDARRRLLKVRHHWYPIMLQLHRFMIAVAGVIVNHDGRGGTAPDPLVWDQGGQRKTRRIDIRVNVDLASLPGPPGFLDGPWLQVHGVGLLVLIFLSGRTVLASFASLLLFLEPCIGRWVLRTYGSFWSFLSRTSYPFSGNGLVIGCSVKRFLAALAC